jgi:acyl-CoA synthetase (AMP-forming)/AMP-acid ligase II
MSLIHILNDRVQHDARQIVYRFLIDGDSAEKCLSFGDFQSHAMRIAAHLADKRARGKCVLLLFRPGLDFIEALFGCMMAGAIAVPLPLASIRRHGDFFLRIAKDVQAEFALTDGTVNSSVTGGMNLGKNFEWINVRTIQEGQVIGKSSICYDERMPAYIQYTSGSTASPKGVPIHHSSLVHNLKYIDDGFRHTPDSKAVTWLPHFHDMGIVYGWFQPLFNGFEGIFLPPATFIESPVRWLSAISRYKATHSGGPNFAFDLCVTRITAEQRQGLDLSSWKVAFNGAEPVRTQTLTAFADTYSPHGFRAASYAPAYGMAEATLKISGGVPGQFEICQIDRAALAERSIVHSPKSSEKSLSLVSAGAPTNDTSVVICEPGRLEPLGSDRLGEILVSSPSVMEGYWNRPTETSETLVRLSPSESSARFLRTGDLGFLHRGQLYICGRFKDVVIVRGKNYYAEDLENLVHQRLVGVDHGAAAVFSLDHSDPERIVVVLETVPMEKHRYDSIVHAICRTVDTEVGSCLLTTVLVRRGAIPRTSSGKVRRSGSKQLFLLSQFTELYRQESSSIDTLGPDLLSSGVMTGENVLDILRCAAAEALGLRAEHINCDEPLITMGVDSLTALKISVAARARFIWLTSERILACESLRSLACGISGEQNESSMIVRESINEADVIPCGGEDQEPVVSADQERLWFMHQVGYGAALNVAAYLELKGSVNTELLEKSIAYVVQQNEALGVTFTFRDGRLTAEQETTSRSSIEVIECNLPNDGDPIPWLNVAQHCTKHVFDLSQGPLFRTTLLRLSAEHSILVLVIHHIVADGWSIRLFFEQVCAAYHAAEVNEVLDPPLLEQARFTDYARWQRDQYSPEASKDVDFWQQELSAFTPLRLSTMYSAATKQVCEAAHLSFMFTGTSSNAIRTAARTCGVTPSATLLAGFFIAVSRYTGSPDVSVCVPIIRRNLPELANTMGFISQPVPLRVHLGSRSFDQLQQLIHTKLHSLSSQHIPFATISEVARRETATRSGPLFPVFFGFALPPWTQSLSNLYAAAGEVALGYTDFELAFRVSESAQEITGTCTYARSRVAPDCAEELVNAFRTVLDEFCDLRDYSRLSRGA